MIEGVCVCWERFKSGEIDLSELIDQLDGIESTHHDWPPALIVNLVQHLESAFDQGNTDQAHLGLIVWILLRVFFAWNLFSQELLEYW